MRAAVLLLLIACGETEAPRVMPAPASSHDRPTADPAINNTTELDGAAPAFGDAVLAELTGDVTAAHAGYERVLAAPDVPSTVAARAAIHLAQLESRAGHTRTSLDLVARATTLAPSDPVVAAGAAALQAEIVAAAGTGDLRGPPLGRPLPNVATDIAVAFAAAERDLAQIHRTHLRITIEALTKSINARVDQNLAVIAKYRAIAERGGLSLVAGTYRSGSLYHDLALELAFADLPQELERRSADGIHATLRGLAIAYLKKAVVEYKACIDAPQLPDGELWRLAAETDMRRATDVLHAAGVRL